MLLVSPLRFSVLVITMLLCFCLRYRPLAVQMHSQMYSSQQGQSEGPDAPSGSRVHKRLADAKWLGDTVHTRSTRVQPPPSLAAYLQLEGGAARDDGEAEALREENAALHASVAAMKRIANSFFSLEIEEDELQKQVR